MTSTPLLAGLSRTPAPGELVFARLGSGTKKVSAALWPGIVQAQPAYDGHCAHGRALEQPARAKVAVTFFGDGKHALLPLSRVYAFDAIAESDNISTRAAKYSMFRTAMSEAHAFAARSRPRAPTSAPTQAPRARLAPAPRDEWSTFACAAPKPADAPAPLASQPGAPLEPCGSETTAMRHDESRPVTPAASEEAAQPSKPTFKPTCTPSGGCFGLAPYGPAAVLPLNEMVFAQLGKNWINVWPAVVLAGDASARGGGGGGVPAIDADTDAPAASSVPGTRVHVEFFGDEKQAALPVCKLFPYEANRESAAVLRRRETTARFDAAMSLAELEYATRKLLLLRAPIGRTTGAICHARADDGRVAAPPPKRQRLWRVAQMSNYHDEPDDVCAEDTSSDAFARRHAPFELLERAGFSSNPHLGYSADWPLSGAGDDTDEGSGDGVFGDDEEGTAGE
ncbi:hypothetical protein KFE25_001213 [Diacronema lutheri]|uniref:PWWP domain-containing protein n=1 Tax=Diacronema lutheri TaxID=2081491 RepID=A0A8J5XCA2_DIALT|nr:hypothetical protein KFE25_001213 [Diacronema lutheri]